MIERKIVIALITSTEYLQKMQGVLTPSVLSDPVAKRLTEWCLEYFNKYKKAPNRDIEAIYFQKLKTDRRMSKDIAEEIEQDILPSLSEEYEQQGLNLDYITTQTENYILERKLLEFSAIIKSQVEEGNLLEAEKLASDFHPPLRRQETGISLNDESSLNKIEEAFNTSVQRLIRYPRQLGEFWNDQLVRDSFVALMGIEKRGKTFLLMDIGMRGVKQDRRVAFFQAGDMSEKQQLRRIAVYIAGRSNMKKYSGKMYEPARDCVFNQTDNCDKDERECNFGVFPKKSENDIRNSITAKEIKSAFKENPKYSPCWNCKQYESNNWGAVWIKEVDTGNPLTSREAKVIWEEFFIKHNRQFKLSTHANGTLSVSQIKTILDIWEKQENFIPDIIVIDYADILIDNTINEFRHKQNKIWMDLRGLSQEKSCLVVTATQTDADSYSKDILRMENFSEDKRKYAHVTAMYGLNMDHKGREKELGILRINEIVIRESDFNNQTQVHVLQNLRRGQPCLTSYW